MTEPEQSNSQNRVLILVNPRAGRRSVGPTVGELVELLTDRGLRPETTSDLDDLTDRSQRWHQDGELRAVVGLGGDGTAAELVNRTAPGIPLTLLPRGTENLLARHLGLGWTPEEACRTIVGGRTLRLDVGQANDRLFVVMASCGFDAAVVQRTHDLRQGNLSRLTYFKPIWSAIRSYSYPPMRIYGGTHGPTDPIDTAANDPWIARWAFVFNVPRYALGLKMAPTANEFDGLLDLCAFRRGSLWHDLRYLTAVLRGRHDRMKDCRLQQESVFRIEAEEPIPYQLDGDPGGTLPVTLSVVPDRLTMLVPPGD